MAPKKKKIVPKKPTKVDGDGMKKTHMLQALSAASCLGNVTDACKAVGISRTTFYSWLKTDEDFAAQAKELKEESVDFVESKLFELIKGVTVETVMYGQPVVYTRPPCKASIIFYLKTIGKERGYVERHELGGPNGDSIPLKVDPAHAGEAFQAALRCIKEANEE